MNGAPTAELFLRVYSRVAGCIFIQLQDVNLGIPQVRIREILIGCRHLLILRDE